MHHRPDGARIGDDERSGGELADCAGHGCTERCVAGSDADASACCDRADRQAHRRRARSDRLHHADRGDSAQRVHRRRRWSGEFPRRAVLRIGVGHDDGVRRHHTRERFGATRRRHPGHARPHSLPRAARGHHDGSPDRSVPPCFGHPTLEKTSERPPHHLRFRSNRPERHPCAAGSGREHRTVRRDRHRSGRDP